MRTVALAFVALLAGLPVLAMPAPEMAAGSAAVALLGAAGVLLRLRPLVTVGAGLALIEYTLALLVMGPAPRPLSAVGLGVALALALDGAELVHRAGPAAIAPAAMRRQALHWAGTAVVGGAGSLGLAVVAAQVRLVGPPVVLPIVAAAGALGAAAAVALALRARG